MKKSRILLICGTAILAVTAVFASKANKKFTAFSTAVGSNANYLAITADKFNTASSGGAIQPAVYLVTITSHHQIDQVGLLIDNNSPGGPAYLPAAGF